ncbi:beta-galactosidase 11 [Elaeis guineensis]|uniref:Beta-galactosidase n=1 Tax=Elaeis guineensis var. tenera TaxID=51953 RepID=A0A6J0PPJ5_ELAGV|nr:beta-galactosidase 11 [Elaeis guineensis]
MARSPESVVRFLGIVCLLFSLSAAAAPARRHHKANASGVTYDGRSFMINGRRELFFSGSIHYPRSTPEMWPHLIQKAKLGGLNVIQTYVFWNIHEPVQGQYNFTGRYDLVRFIKLIHKHKMYVTLRLGPFIQAEWNYGGFPYWMKEVPGVVFRTDNEPFKYHMQNFVTKIMEMMKSEKLFFPQGGPIILGQIENEYNMVEAAYREGGLTYVQWAANLALGFNAGIPWVMCKQKDAPGPVINACNGRNCGDTFTGPNSPTKPSVWTENWTAQYRVFGDPPSQRSAEDIAYSVARFFSKNGTLVNYYMYHGGTNFGREGASYVMTRYYDEAPLDEYGLLKEPKYGHLRDLHQALKLSRKGLLWGVPSVQPLGEWYEARLYESPESNVCVAFLTNTNPRVDGTVNFRGTDYFLPHRSISILPDCKTVVFNTQMVNAQHNARTFRTEDVTRKNDKWQMFQERIPKFLKKGIVASRPLDLYNMTKDITDYMWYTTRFRLEDVDLPMRPDIRPVLLVSSLGHAMHAFVNGIYIGSGHGAKLEKSFVFQKPMDLKQGVNHISILGMTVGFPDNGAYLEHRLAGVHTAAIQGLNTGTLDLSPNKWGHEVGMKGEKLGIYTEEGSKKVKWTEAKSGQPVTWYKRYFDMPSGNDPVALDMTGMGKGLAWVNGNCIGRYWVSYLSPLGKPSQSVYHVPRGWLKPKDNLLVIFEESGGNPEGLLVVTVKRDNICTVVTDLHPPTIESFSREDSEIKNLVQDGKPSAHLTCDKKKVIRSIAFASFGNPTGACGNFTVGTCHSPQTASIVEKACLGKNSCVLPVSAQEYGADPACPGTTNTLAVQAKCARQKKEDKD